MVCTGIYQPATYADVASKIQPMDLWKSRLFTIPIVTAHIAHSGNARASKHEKFTLVTTGLWRQMCLKHGLLIRTHTRTSTYPIQRGDSPVPTLSRNFRTPEYTEQLNQVYFGIRFWF